MYKVSPFMRVCLNLWAWCVVFLFLGALLASGAHAQALPVGVSPVFAPSVAGNVVTYSGGTATAANASTIAFPDPANGPVYGQSTQSINVGAGRTASVIVKSRPSPAVVAKAVSNFAVKTVGILAAGKALYDLCNELGFNCARATETGPLVVTKPDPNKCPTSSACTGWYVYGAGVASASTDKAAVCSAWGAASGSGYRGVVRASGSSFVCDVWRPDGSYVSSRSDAIVQTALPGNTGAGLPSTLQELESAIAAKSGWPSTSALPRLLPDVLASGEPLPMPAPYEITGPTQISLPPEVVQMPDGSKITTQPEKQLSYGPNTVTVTDKSTRTETSPSGVTTPISTTTSAQPLPQPAPTPAPAPEIKTCGYPGGPACKIDETGTPEALPKGQYLPSLDEYKTKADENRTTIGGSGDKPFFTGWNLFFFAPALAPCEPMTLPDFEGRPMGQLDACNVVDGTRSVMSYIWALGALFLCLGMIKKVV